MSAPVKLRLRCANDKVCRSLINTFVLFRRAHSVSDDASSELQRIAAVERKDVNSPNPFCRRGGLSRYGGEVIISTG